MTVSFRSDPLHFYPGQHLYLRKTYLAADLSSIFSYFFVSTIDIYTYVLGGKKERKKKKKKG